MLKFKKLIAIPAVILISICMFTVISYASSASTGTIGVVNYLNIRSAGNTGARIIGKLYNSNTVTIVGSNNGWDEISYKGLSGWISSQFVITGTKQTVVDAVLREIGIKYIYDGASPIGFDCSGLTMYAYDKVGITLPHSASEQASYGWWVSKSELRPGDLLFFDTDGGKNVITHVGIYIGGDIFISAESGAGEVMEASLNNTYWSGAFVTARRLLN